MFGPPSPDHAQTAKLVQHGFARTSRWEFLGKSTSESAAGAASVKLDFGLSSAAEGLDPAAREAWPFKFSLIYSVTLSPGSLTTAIVATNDDDKPFDCHALFHTYLRVDVCFPLDRSSSPVRANLRRRTSPLFRSPVLMAPPTSTNYPPPTPIRPSPRHPLQ